MRMRIAERARRLDEAGGGDRLARRRRVAEAVAAHRARILAGELAAPRRLVVLARRRLELVLLVGVLGLESASAWPFPLPLPSSAGAGSPRSARSASRRARRSGACAARCPAASRGGFDESTRSRPSRSRSGPSTRRRPRRPAVDLGERLVERGAPGRSGRERLGRIFAGMKEGLAGPFLCSERVGGQAVRRVRRECRVQYRF